MQKLYRDILNIIQQDSRLSAAAISAMLQVKEQDIKAAIAQMEKDGTILKYTVLCDDEKLETESVEALIEVKVSPVLNMGFDAIAEEIYQFSEVKSLYLMSGAYDLAVFIEGATLKEVARFVSEKLSVMDKVLSTATHFILKKYKKDGVITSGAQLKRIAVHP